MRIDPQKLLSSCAEAFCVGVAFAVGAAIVVSVLLGLIVFFAGDAKAAEVQMPRAALQYRATLIRQARAAWGLNAPVAVFAAQIHTESWYGERRLPVASSERAEGLAAQFIPARTAPGGPAPLRRKSASRKQLNPVVDRASSSPTNTLQDAWAPPERQEKYRPCWLLLCPLTTVARAG